MKIAIVGGGASGFALAGLLSEKKKELNLEIAIYEQGTAPLRKVRATGNGRCNFTNRNMAPDFYTGGSSSFVKPILERFSFPQALDFFDSLGMPTVSLESGMTYPRTQMAETVASLLYAKALHGGVELFTEKKAVELKRSGKGFEIQWEGPGKTSSATYPDLVVLSTGGAFGIGKKEWSNGYSLVKSLGHHLRPIHPGIVALTVQEKDLCQALCGLKMEADFNLTIGNEQEEKKDAGDLIFTDYGLSGIGIFRLSNQVLDALQDEKEIQLKINLFPDWPEENFSSYLYRQFQKNAWTAEEVARGILPNKAAGPLLKRAGIDPKAPAKSLTWEETRTFSALLHGLVFHPTGRRKKDHGQITCGGIATDQVNAQTLMSTIQPGLFFTGEVLDVQGICGGYNLHWAWASAFTAYQGIIDWIRQAKQAKNSPPTGGDVII